MIALLILEKFGCAITYPTNAGKGPILSLPISAVKVPLRVKFSEIFMILKRKSASKDFPSADLSAEPTAAILLSTY